jgi:DNA-binding beta-propeller fold protein YncE
LYRLLKPIQSFLKNKIMIKNLSILFCAALGLLFGCTKEWQNPNPQKPAVPVTINFSQHDLYPEGLAYDPVHNVFLVSSATVGTIGIVTFDGNWKPAINDEVLTGTTGLKVDKIRNRLLVCNVESGVGAYDLTTGSRLFFADFSPLLPQTPLFINDEVVDPDGNLYVTNSVAPVIYKVDRNGNASVFFQNDAFATGPADFGFNGIQYDQKGFLLVTHTGFNEIIKIPISNPSSYSTVQLNETLTMPDGLMLSKDGKQLVVVSNDRVLSFLSNDQWQSGSLSTSFNTAPNYGTSLTSDGKKVFVLYSPMDKLLNGEDQDDYTIEEVQLNKADSF